MPRFFEMGMSVPEVALISRHKDVRQLFNTLPQSKNVFKKYERSITAQRHSDKCIHDDTNHHQNYEECL